MSASTTLRWAARSVFALVAMGVVATGAAALAGSASAAEPSAIASGQFDQTMIQLVNQARHDNGVAPLAEAKGLDSVAHGWSGKLNTGSTAYNLQHDPNAWNEVGSNGAANRTTWGENVAWSSSTATSAEAIFTAYMHSPGHRANILNKSYHYIGMGSSAGAHGIWNTTEFTDKVQTGQVVVAKTPSAAQKSLIAGWVVNLLGRQATASDVAVQGGALANGARPATVASTILSSTAGWNHEVNNYYRHYVGHLPSATDLYKWTNALASGTSTEIVLANLLGTADVWTKTGQTADGYLTYAAQAAMGRTPTAAELTTWKTLLSDINGRTLAAKAVVSSHDARAYRIDGYYRAYLNRAADAASLHGQMVAYTDDANARLAILTSHEYQLKHS